MEPDVSLKELSFVNRLQGLINEYSMENNSDTPDFVLAGYLRDCLTAFNLATHRREQFYGRQCGSLKGVVSEHDCPDQSAGGIQ